MKKEITKITLREITADNFWDIIELNVSEEQKELVASNAVSIAQSKVQPECIPMAIYSDDIPVGFIMYCIDRDDNEYWIYRLMIDKKFQSKGFGRRAMEIVINIIKKDCSRNKIYLGVDKQGVASVKLYEVLGFRFNGKVYGKEHIMVMEY
ncbi:GNAT family N-acetyltransferase [Alkaliphilus sp. MSJ-5]|uniref:GNAT family N-acetyltransferase n=1 Tax=Alkaliphilus flagellatus TaxID=2841507 RepID=A0ABS6FZC8_9FIRM|nr:GNAT family N-acetyltransferase [Alkaliphilus flagellatus]MBU5675423.1 GNAT family N-acetyltransferase [Alkaliphilus flagellatus]